MERSRPAAKVSAVRTRIVRDALSELGGAWAYDGVNGTAHHVFRHKRTGAVFSMACTPKDTSLAKRYARKNAKLALRRLSLLPGLAPGAPQRPKPSPL